jgi:hypothetical protein
MMSLIRKVSFVWLAVLAVGALGTTPAFADSIAPDTFSATLAVGGSTTVDKVVTISLSRTSPVDVFFLVDTTGSMGSTIADVRTGFADIVTALAGIAGDVAFGVGEYKDVSDGLPYAERLDLTTNTADVQTAINGLSASGGGDTPEANLSGLTGVANNTSWRAGSQRFVVWVGDAPGHDPSGANTEATTIAALNGVNVDVFAASATSGPGLNAAADTAAGQADRIVAGAGGEFLGTFDPTGIADAVTDALVTGISTYSSVGLSVVGLPAGVSVSLPPAIVGAFDRSIERVFNFDDVLFTGLAPGTYNFTIDAVLDGTTVVATETDTITVGDATIPEPATLTLLGLGLASSAAARRRQLRKAKA